MNHVHWHRWVNCHWSISCHEGKRLIFPINDLLINSNVSQYLNWWFYMEIGFVHLIHPSLSGIWQIVRTLWEISTVTKACPICSVFIIVESSIVVVVFQVHSVFFLSKRMMKVFFSFIWENLLWINGQK